jgi:hypothetical protein
MTIKLLIIIYAISIIITLLIENIPKLIKYIINGKNKEKI